MTGGKLATVIFMVAASVAISSPATAKTCKGTLTEKKIAPNDASATKAAITAWSSSAKRKYGAKFANWSKADGSKVTCKVHTLKIGVKLLCIASGKPCSD